MAKRVEVLIGKKVSLVVPEKQDAEIWYQGMNDLETQKLLNQHGNILHRETEEEYYENLRKDKAQKTFSIYLRDEKIVIGNVSLMNINYKNNNAILGIMICDKENRNKGYGTQSVKLILQYAFGTLGLHKVSLAYIDINARAARVYKNVGFQEIGRKKEQLFVGGVYHDVVLMEIFKSDYDNRK